MTQPDARRAHLLALAAEVAAADTDDDALAIMRNATGLTITDPDADRAELARRVAAAELDVETPPCVTVHIDTHDTGVHEQDYGMGVISRHRAEDCPEPESDTTP